NGRRPVPRSETPIACRDGYHTGDAMHERKSWREKLADSGDLPKVTPQRRGSGTMVIPAPREVDELMRQVPLGKLLSMREIRQTLAARHGTDSACPPTTGIFAWIAAHAAEEAAAEGETDTTPYWRTLKAGGELNSKYP